MAAITTPLKTRSPPGRDTRGALAVENPSCSSTEAVSGDKPIGKNQIMNSTIEVFDHETCRVVAEFPYGIDDETRAFFADRGLMVRRHEFHEDFGFDGRNHPNNPERGE